MKIVLVSALINVVFTVAGSWREHTLLLSGILIIFKVSLPQFDTAEHIAVILFINCRVDQLVRAQH